ncbi:LysR substrate-binding domain-containing protein [Terriglobus saanensis]|uniref:Transcriptional regulator, LysR family n=1 Tax=Terriglobus saanensis (strain ATCC BAA-1853 / DSM 23119 / SP1PR4) TaxID=401053 RepID=E8UYX2_TERSS|nr:LysR substrate-binding domain-containing protein [Terriglobus saanensis]ADV84338.1 transcriptional regulator, LysR family [Terriglobus saanensis SP1PR4]
MNEEIELRHLRYFLAVAETLHFSEAARRLGMAQPPLSQQIKRLEEILGHQLFNRTTRGVRLTPAGSLLVERARSTLAKVNDDIEQVRHIGRGEEGTLTVGFAGSVIFTPLPAAIRTFRRLYPRVELRLQEMFTSGQIAALHNGTLDLAFLRDGDPTEGLTQLTLRKEPYVAILSEKHPLASKKTLQVKDLAGEPFVLFDRRMGPLAFDRTVACCERAGFRPNIIQNAPQWPTVVRLVAAGLGVSLAPACVTAVTIPGTVYRPVRTISRTTIDVAFRQDHDTQPAKNFLAIAQTHLSG